MKDIPVKSAKFIVDVDSPNKFKDGLFNFTVDYDIDFLFKPIFRDDPHDTGKLHCETKKDGEFHQATCAFKSKFKNKNDGLTTFQVDIKRDYSSMIIGRFHYGDQSQKKNATFEIDLTNNDYYLIKGVYNSEKNYSFMGQVKMHDIFLEVQVDDMKYVTSVNSWYDNIKKADRGQVFCDFGPINQFDFQYLVRRDFSEASVKFTQNQVNYLTAKFMATDTRYKYEMMFSGFLIGGGEDHATLLFRRAIQFQYESHLGLIVDVTFDLSKGSYQVSTRDNGKKTFKFHTEIDYTNDYISFDLKSNVDWFIEERGTIYRFFNDSNCLLCLSSFKAQCNLAKVSKGYYTFRFSTLQEDGQLTTKIDIDFQFLNKFKVIVSEDSLSLMFNMLNYNQTFDGEIEVEGEWKQDLFRVISNKDWLRTFLIQKIDGYMRKVELNGKELLKFGWKINTGRHFQILFDIELPSGHSLHLKNIEEDIVVNYSGLNYEMMKVVISSHTMESPYDNLTIAASGRNAILGNFNIERTYNYRYNRQGIRVNGVGETEISNSPLGPDNIHTEYEFCSCVESLDWSFLIEDTKFSSGLDYVTMMRFLDVPIFSIPLQFLSRLGFM